MTRFGAGAFIYCSNTGRFLMGKRHPNDEYMPNYFSLYGGTGEDGETPYQTMIREVYEESGLIVDNFPTTELLTFHENNGFCFFNFLVVMPNELIPFDTDEMIDGTWFNMNQLPEKTHDGVIFLFNNDIIIKEKCLSI